MGFKAKYISYASANTFDGKNVLLRNQTTFFFKTGNQFASNFMVNYIVAFITIKNLKGIQRILRPYPNKVYDTENNPI